MVEWPRVQILFCWSELWSYVSFCELFLQLHSGPAFCERVLQAKMFRKLPHSYWTIFVVHVEIEFFLNAISIHFDSKQTEVSIIVMVICLVLKMTPNPINQLLNTFSSLKLLQYSLIYKALNRVIGQVFVELSFDVMESLIAKTSFNGCLIYTNSQWGMCKLGIVFVGVSVKKKKKHVFYKYFKVAISVHKI